MDGHRQETRERVRMKKEDGNDGDDGAASRRYHCGTKSNKERVVTTDGNDSGDVGENVQDVARLFMAHGEKTKDMLRHNMLRHKLHDSTRICPI